MFSPMLAFRSSGQIVTTTREGWTPSPAVSLSTIESGSRSEARAAHHNEEAGSSHFARNPLVSWPTYSLRAAGHAPRVLHAGLS